MRRILTAAAAAGFAAWLLMPADGAAKGFGVGLHHGHGLHQHHQRAFWPYGSTVPAYSLGDSAGPVATAPAQVNTVIAPAPRCTHSQEFYTVPSEDGGERKVTITRC
jgi:hypothetical protein